MMETKSTAIVHFRLLGLRFKIFHYPKMPERFYRVAFGPCLFWEDLGQCWSVNFRFGWHRVAFQVQTR